MNATSISLVVLIVLSAILLLRWMLKLNPQITGGFRSQRMCSSCGLITSRKARCLECGAVSAAKP
jgi:hypothetical protein